MDIHEMRSIRDVEQFAVDEFTRNDFGDDLIHGLRHLRRVQAEYEIIRQMCVDLLEPELLKCLGVAVAIHDLGRIRKGNHAENSAEMFLALPIHNLLSTDEIEAVYYAVKNHSRGLEYLGIDKAETFKDKLLGLLCLCDHADAASPEGAARAALQVAKIKAPILSTQFTANHLSAIMAQGASPDMMNDYKNDSLIAHLAYNYSADFSICCPIFHLLNTRYYNNHHAPNIVMFQALIEPLLILQEVADEATPQ